jgi:hypothetical protein
VYLGEANARRGIVYDSRRLDTDGQSFVFRTELAGEYALKFFRQDFIRDVILNDYVQVIVGNPPETAGTAWFNPSIDRGRVIAEPRWPSALAEAQSVREGGRPVQAPVLPPTAEPGNAAVQPPVRPPAAQVQPQPPASTVPAAPPSSPPVPATPPVAPPVAEPPSATTPQAVPVLPDIAPGVDPETYLEKAKEEFEAGRVASAISFLDQYRGYYPQGTDELLWLYGQFYEANSPSRNILSALDCYRRLVDEYPQSSRHDAARGRIAYLQRYYININ